MSLSEDPIHITFVAIQAWGHVRPLCALVARMATWPRVNITVFTSTAMYVRVTAEILRNLDDADTMSKDCLRIVGLKSDAHILLNYEVMEQDFAIQFQQMLNGRPMRCAKTESNIQVLQIPSALVVDTYAYKFFKIARQQTQGAMKILAWNSGSLRSVYALYGPFTSSSRGLLQRKVDAVMAESGRSVSDVTHTLLASPTDEVQRTPGLPPMYNYENFPQELYFKAQVVGNFYLGANNIIHECDGLIVNSSELYEPQETVDVFNEFFAQDKREMYLTMMGHEVTHFLDQSLGAHGKHRLVYISFGTIFWPTEPEKMWALLDILMGKGIPFIMSHASHRARVPEHIVDKVAASGLGLLASWTPQQAILAHPATGWFVTHGGFNSITESMCAGVPMICWPYANDQAVNVVHLTENLGVAYELLEVRSGDGLRPIYRTGKASIGTLDAVREEMNHVLDAAFGEDGQEKRAKIAEIREASTRMWDKGGKSRIAMENLVDWLV